MAAPLERYIYEYSRITTEPKHMERKVKNKVTYSAKSRKFIFSEHTENLYSPAEFKQFMDNMRSNLEELNKDLKETVEEGITQLEDGYKKQLEACSRMKERIQAVKDSIPIKEMMAREREEFLRDNAREYKLACDIVSSKEAAVVKTANGEDSNPG